MWQNNRNNRNNSAVAWVLIVMLLLIVTNLGTYLICKYYPVFRGGSVVVDTQTDKETSANVKKLVYLIGELRENYLWDIDEDEMWDSIFKGLMGGIGDDYAEYMTQEEYKEYQTTLSGSYSGIGVQIMNDDDGNVSVTKVFKDTPAFDAGMQPGDVIVAADGHDITNTNISVAVTYIRGETGTSVTLDIYRDGEYLTKTIVRKSIDLVYVSSRMIGSDIGYIYISEFETNTFDQFTEAVDELTAQGMKGLILDLRQNPGGDVSECVNIADSLLPKTTIIYTKNKAGEKTVYKSDGKSLGIPLVLLVDGYSASSSEILSIALKDNNAAEIVGTKTFGKGIMQILLPLSDGSLYKYTFCEYFGPNDTKIHGIGITPDYIVELPEEYRNKVIETIPEEDDTQLKKAIEVVREKMGR
ncbi:MAG: S41 family peptidase [Eubacteriaceae bacterium]|nr:S41 family peptidase [Eubacteriaceae bacterium]